MNGEYESCTKQTHFKCWQKCAFDSKCIAVSFQYKECLLFGCNSTYDSNAIGWLTYSMVEFNNVTGFNGMNVTIHNRKSQNAQSYLDCLEKSNSILLLFNLSFLQKKNQELRTY